MPRSRKLNESFHWIWIIFISLVLYVRLKAIISAIFRSIGKSCQFRENGGIPTNEWTAQSTSFLRSNSRILLCVARGVSVLLCVKNTRILKYCIAYQRDVYTGSYERSARWADQRRFTDVSRARGNLTRKSQQVDIRVVVYQWLACHTKRIRRMLQRS